jgi:hypothetical protein
MALASWVEGGYTSNLELLVNNFIGNFVFGYYWFNIYEDSISDEKLPQTSSYSTKWLSIQFGRAQNMLSE